jgi:hypothetical protein
VRPTAVSGRRSEDRAPERPVFAIAGLNNPDLELGPEPYRVRTVGPTSSPVRSIGGVLLDTRRHTSNAPE